MTYRKGIIGNVGDYVRAGENGRSIFRLADGTLYFVDGINFVYKSTDDGYTWVLKDSSNAPICLTDTPNAAINSSGNLCIVYGISGGWAYIIFDHLTDTYGTAENIFPGLYNCYPMVCIDNNDHPHVAYEENSIVYYTNRTSGAWSIPEQISDGPSAWNNSANIIVVGTTIYTVWKREVFPDPGYLRYRQKTGGVWGSIESPSPLLTDANPTFCIEKTGIIHIFFNSVNNVIHTYGTSGSFSDEIVYNNVPDSAGYSGLDCAVLETSGVNLYVSGGQETTFYPLLSRKIGTGAWETIVLETTEWDVSNIFWSYYNYNNGDKLRMVYFVQGAYSLEPTWWDSYYYDFLDTVPTTLLHGFQVIMW